MKKSILINRIKVNIFHNNEHIKINGELCAQKTKQRIRFTFMRYFCCCICIYCFLIVLSSRVRSQRSLSWSSLFSTMYFIQSLRVCMCERVFSIDFSINKKLLCAFKCYFNAKTYSLPIHSNRKCKWFAFCSSCHCLIIILMILISQIRKTYCLDGVWNVGICVLRFW